MQGKADLVRVPVLGSLFAALNVRPRLWQPRVACVVRFVVFLCSCVLVFVVMVCDRGAFTQTLRSCSRSWSLGHSGIAPNSLTS